jgi:chlorite dismutase
MNTNTFTHFTGSAAGQWKVLSMAALSGNKLESVSYLSIGSPSAPITPEGAWTLTGYTSNIRYTEKAEQAQLNAIRPELGRPSATCAALIPIRKSSAWWDLAQDERRKIFEQRSHHISIGIQYLPAIARKLYHARDIGEPFDFLTWFEFAPEHTDSFDHLLASLRASEEWSFVEREVEIRLVRV